MSEEAGKTVEAERDRDDVVGEAMSQLAESLSRATLDEKRPDVISSADIQGIAEYIKSGKAKNIVVMSGAGVSVSAGIPDFRTPGTGLYSNLEKYNLPYPQAIFTIRENPMPFTILSKEMYPGNFKPTPAHYFVKLLERKGLLLRNYTQNIDTLERVAGISDDKLVEAHGSFSTNHCIECKKEYSQEFVKERYFKEEPPKCEACGGLVKPDIVFFGESLPDKFFTCMLKDFKICDLLIVMGTSLTVYPFAGLIDLPLDEAPRILINLEEAGEADIEEDGDYSGDGFRFFDKHQKRDVWYKGTCDDGVRELASLLEWKEDLEALIDEPIATASMPTSSKI